MTKFKDTPETLERVDFRILSNGGIRLYRDRRLLSADLAWLEREGYEMVHFDCSGFQHLMSRMKQEFYPPDYFHGSLDSLNDCLRDIRVKGIGMVVVFNRMDQLQYDIIHTILDMFVDITRQYLIFGRRLITLIKVDDPDFMVKPVGAISI